MLQTPSEQILLRFKVRFSNDLFCLRASEATTPISGSVFLSLPRDCALLFAATNTVASSAKLKKRRKTNDEIMIPLAKANTAIILDNGLPDSSLKCDLN